MDENDFLECRTHTGLRAYGKLVLDKIKQKGTANFEEVVNEIYDDFAKAGLFYAPNKHSDLKNVRRRIYDVLNVLSELRMIPKDGETIKWISDQPEEVPHEQRQLEKEKQDAEESIERIQAQLKELLLQIISYKSLTVLKKNVPMQPDKDKIHLPFIAVKTDKRAQVSCKVSEDKFQHLFTFDHPFEIHDDIEVLKRMGLAFGLETSKATIEELEVCKSTIVAKQFEEDFCIENSETITKMDTK